MNQMFDAIVVGGGPGGLATGCLLAQSGQKVLLLEREQQLGGRYRAVEFAGSRCDNAVHIMSCLTPTLEESYAHKLFQRLDYDFRQKPVNWVMCLVGRQPSAEWMTMDRAKGIANFFEFFAFGAGMQLGEEEKQALSRAFYLMSDMSEDVKRRGVSTSFADWLDRFVENPTARTIIEMCCPLMGAPAAEVNCGQMANIFGVFPRIGAVPFWYPEEGMLEDAVIKPLAEIFTRLGGEIRTGWTGEKVLTAGDAVRGIWAKDNAKLLYHDIQAPVVIVSFPIFQAVGEGCLVGPSMLSDSWRQSVSRCAQLTHKEFSGFYLLRKKIIPSQTYGWFHVFDGESGIPTYVGDCIRADFCNAEVPDGKQLCYSYVPATTDADPFGMDTSPEMVRRANERWKDAMEKAFPGFRDSIEAEGMNLQLNWGRYAWAVVPAEIGVQSPGLRGLYFSGDSVLSVSSLASDKVFQVAMDCAAAILRDQPRVAARGQ